MLCGTDDRVSVYSLDGSSVDPAPTPAPVPDSETPDSDSEYTLLGCSSDSKSSRVSEEEGGKYALSTKEAIGLIDGVVAMAVFSLVFLRRIVRSHEPNVR